MTLSDGLRIRSIPETRAGARQFLGGVEAEERSLLDVGLDNSCLAGLRRHKGGQHG